MCANDGWFPHRTEIDLRCVTKRIGVREEFRKRHKVAEPMLVDENNPVN